MTTGHPTRETLERLKVRMLSGQDLLSADEHLIRCAECRSAVGDSEQTSEIARRALVALDEDHLSFEEMSSYADGLGDPEQRSAAAMHMEVCRMCRTEVSDLSEIPVPVVSRRRRTTSYAIAAILAAVLVGGAALLWNQARKQEIREPVETAHQVPPATRPGPPSEVPVADPLAQLNPSLRDVVEALNQGTLASATLVASLQGKQGQQRSSETDPSTVTRVLEPVGEVIETDRPTFRWSPLHTSGVAVVQLFDAQYNPVLESPEVAGTSWTSPSNLKRGVTYRWQLVIRTSAESTTLPAPPDPPAQFRVLGSEALAELHSARRSGSELEAGLICMREGLFEEGSRRISAFAKAHPGAELSRLAEKARGTAKSAEVARRLK